MLILFSILKAFSSFSSRRVTDTKPITTDVQTFIKGQLAKEMHTLMKMHAPAPEMLNYYNRR